MKNVHENLICCTKFCFHSLFYILGIFFKHPLCLTVIKLCILVMRSSIQKCEFTRKSLRSNPVADLNIFWSLDTYLWILFLFLLDLCYFIDFENFLWLFWYVISTDLSALWRCFVSWYVYLFHLDDDQLQGYNELHKLIHYQRYVYQLLLFCCNPKCPATTDFNC